MCGWLSWLVVRGDVLSGVVGGDVWCEVMESDVWCEVMEGDVWCEIMESDVWCEVIESDYFNMLVLNIRCGDVMECDQFWEVGMLICQS